ncbi:MAG: response regulator transcription factor [Thermoleophilaceae bacterium]
MKLLIVEDDDALRGVLLRSLRAEGFEADAVATGRDLLEHASRATPDAFVIDIGLPDADGRDVCQALRSQGISSPVLFLTARDALTDRLSGFKSGGDDYVTKPFDIEEVVVRLEALLRRAGSEPTLDVSGLTLDPSEMTVSSGSVTQALTPTEFRLLAALAGRPGKAVSRRELVRTAWPHGAIVQDNTLDVYIARLRRKLEQLPDAPRITTVHGLGYRMQ